MRRATLVIAIAALLVGCGGGSSQSEEQPAQATPNTVQPGAPGEPSRKLSPAEAQKAGAVEATEADVQFMQDMIHHHSQAIEMTGWVPDRTASTSVRLLAKRMQISQEAEIELMERWLEAQDVEPMSDHAAHDTLMPGMLTEAQMDKLEAAKGPRFDRLFLRFMTRHHQGALTMVAQLRTSDGGAEPGIDAFARGVEADQQIEIQRMQDLLAKR